MHRINIPHQFGIPMLSLLHQYLCHTTKGITCSTVGRMVNDDVLQCSDNSGQNSLAGYQYSTLLGRAPLMDVEMRKVEILIENGINHFPEDQELLLGTAFDLYKYGENPGMAKTSLSKIARETNRDIVPTFQAFERYFSNEENYADVLIVRQYHLRLFF